MRFLLIACLAVSLFVGPARATTENAALELVLEDLKSLPREEQLFTRYIWVTDGEFESIQASSLTLNYTSRGVVPIRPFYRSREVIIKVAGPDGKVKDYKKRIVVMRVPLKGYASKQADLNDVVKVWESFQFDPRFNLLLTKDTLKFAGVILDRLPKVKRTIKKTKMVLKDVPVYEKDGKFYNQKWEDEVYDEVVETNGLEQLGKEVQIIRLVSEHIDKNLIAQIIDATQSQAPVVNHRYYITRALSTIKGKGVFPIIYGGLYYELSGIKKGFKKGTDEDNFLAKLGIGNIEQGVVAKRIFDEIGSDQRVALFKSGVTGKPRRVDVLKTLAGRDNQGIVSITHDLKDDDIDIGTHPIMNLVDFVDRAREVIFEKQNGLQGFVLFNGNGELQDEVPPDVAADTTIPSPHGTRLQPAIGCIRCHAKEGGWRVSNNDVKKLLGGYLDAFNDRTDRKKSIPEIVERLAGQYAGDLEFKIFSRARDDYAAAILRSTGPWVRSKDQTNVVRLASDKIGDLYKQYNYEVIGTMTALAELDVPGIDEKLAVAAFRKLLPPINVIIDGIIPEDPRIGALLTGLSLNRSDWDLVYSFVATRLEARHKVPLEEKRGP